MQQTFITTVFGLIVLLLWGMATWMLSNISKKNGNPWQINLSLQLTSAVGLVSVAILFPDEIALNGRSLFFIVVTQVFFLAALLMEIKALSKGPTGIVIPLENIYPLFVLFMSIAFLGQKFNFMEITAIMVVVFGAMAVAFDKSISYKKLTRLSVDKELALAAAVMWGIGNFAINAVVKEVSWQTFYVIGNIISFGITVVLAYVMGGKSFKIFKIAARDKLAIIAGVIFTAGSIVYYMGATLVGDVVIILSIAAAQPLVASLLSRVFNKEILAMHQRVGAVMIVLGIVMINLN